jgi:hypothetical protein
MIRACPGRPKPADLALANPEFPACPADLPRKRLDRKTKTQKPWHFRR